MDHAIPQCQRSTLHPGSQMIYYNYHFCHNYFCTQFASFSDVLYSIGTTWNKTDIKYKNWQRKQSKKKSYCRRNSNYNWLFGYLMEAKVTVELWEYEIRAGPFCDRESAKSTVKKKWGGSPSFAFFFFSCYAFERMNTSKVTQIERSGK